MVLRELAATAAGEGAVVSELPTELRTMLLAELREVLAREKFRRYVTEADVVVCVDLIRHEATMLDDPAPSTRPLSADPDDEYLVDLARAAAVDVLVSGDAHLLDLRDQLPILTPAEFLAALGG